ncbi:MAG: FAD-dependent oxidoreductase [Deltaproteobacteria bacterium]|nr:MAG: FAD-dependent oxidoreductase [Deltaproteobacteria bacterium]
MCAEKARSGNGVVGSVMVAGGGIAGIQAALDLANSGYYVHLVEKSPAIGGIMAQLDKTFPTNDCSMCIISPKLVECGQHPNINLITCAELESVTGEEGNLQAIVRQHPRYIDLEKCTGCGDCAEVCPVTMPSEFDEGIGPRKAAYKPYAQAIPGGYMIDKRDQSPCTYACPNHVNAHAYVALIAQGKYREAMEVILRTLPFPGVIGRICPHPCETECRRGQVDAPLSICALKRFVADQVDIEELPMPDISKRDEKVAIIGSGPAGLTAAHFLALEGYQSTVFEAQSAAGGMLRVGIPDYRLPPEVLDKEIRAITRLGVEIKLNTALGRDVTIDGLFSEGYKAVYLAIGAHNNLQLNIPGEEAEGVIPGVSFLRKVNLGELTGLEGGTLIVGGGDVAIDAARSARRLGTEKVTILYRRTRAEMPARENEVEDALAEGIEIQYLTAPQQILTKDNKVVGIQCIRMELGEPDSSGRRRPVPVPGSEFIVEGDWVLPAIGQTPESAFLADTSGVEVSRWGTIEADPVTFTTNVEGVFAGGDAHTGPWVAIGAVAAGREAAVSISRYLRGEDVRAGREPIEFPQEDFVPIPEDIDRIARAEQAMIGMAERTAGFAEVELGLTEEQARNEAQKCLNCMSCCECFECVNACQAQAVEHWMGEQEIALEVGTVVLAPGADTFDPSIIDTYLYGRHPNVVTSIEFERILSASGPFQGHMIRPSDHKEPKKIAWIQCVGSRNVQHCDNGYCSAVCCMYAIKEAIVANEHSDEPLDTAIFFMDMRTYGKDFEKYYIRAQEDYGVRFIRSRIHSIDPADNDNLKLQYADDSGVINEEEFDMVVLSVGLQPSSDAVELAGRLDIELNHYNFAETTSFEPVKTSRDGVYVCGAFRDCKDIPISVMEASAAAAAAATPLKEARNTMTTIKELPAERSVVGEEPRVGVFVCNCGINIGGVADVPAVAEYAKTLPQVAYVSENLFTCSQDTQEKMREVIKENNLNRVVVAACSPRTHEPLFQETMREVGLNPYLFEMANIRDQNTWVHQQDKEAATGKAKDLLRMAVARASLLDPLQPVTLGLNKSGLVVGGGVAGMVASLTLAEQGFPVQLVEVTDQLGGNARKLRETWKGEDVGAYVEQLASRVEANKDITVHFNTKVSSNTGFVGNFETVLENVGDPGQKTTVQHGVTVLATGGRPFQPTEYLYGDDDRVFTHLDFDAQLKENGDVVRKADRAVFIQCVGSREPDRPYCSKVCCTHSVESAIKLKELNPETDVYILYRDIRTYSFREDLYKKARELGVFFIRYSLERKPQVSNGEGQLKIQVHDPILDREVVIPTDLLILAAAILPNEVAKVAESFKVSQNAEGFFLEAHAKLRPVDLGSDGLFLCGLAHYPKPIEESIAQAQAAAARAATILAKDIITLEAVKAVVEPDLCAVCLTCVRTCPYDVPYIGEEGAAVIDPAGCRGCGACVAECPGKAISLQHFTDRQLIAKCDALLLS